MAPVRVVVFERDLELAKRVISASVDVDDNAIED
jgi:hypothetical protein